MAFNFVTPTSSSEPAKPATTSAPAEGSIFGSIPSSGTSKFSFGPPANNSASSGNAGSAFGQQSSGDAQKPTVGLFIGPSSSAATPGSTTPASAGGVFGGGSSTTPSSTGAVFGGAQPTTTSSASPAPASGLVFGGIGSTTTAQAPAGLFPNLSGPTKSGGGLSTGWNTTTPGQETPTTSAAPDSGSVASTGISFGNMPEKTPSTQAAAPAAPLMATPAKPLFTLGSTTPAGAPPLESSKPAAAASTSGLFGGGQTGVSNSSGGGNLFSTKPASSSATSAGGLFTNVGGSSAPSTSGAPTGGLFDAKPTSTSTVAGKPAATTGGALFGGAATSTTGASSMSAATTAPAGGLFGSKTTASAATSPAAPETAPSTSSPFGNAQSSAGASTQKPAASTFGAPSAANISQPASTDGTAATTMPKTAPAATGSLFGAAKPAAEGADKAQDTTKSAAQNGTASALGASTNGPTSQIPRLKNKTMEEIITRWASDLSKYQKKFKEQATIVSTWDRDLVDNGEKIQKLYLDTFEAERASHEIERQLVTVESQQDELEAWLNRYESEVQDMFAKQIGPGEQLAGPDQERERTYKLAEKLTQQLDEKSRDLAKMVKEINDISGSLSKGAKTEDPLSQIVRVLNGHLTQLQWIDVNAAALQAKVTAAQKSSSTLGSHYGGVDNDAAESFYRSYMGRR